MTPAGHQPLLSHCLFESISLLNEAEKLFTEKCVKGIKANEEVCRELVDRGWKNWGLPALVPYFGYDKATDIARQAAQDGTTPREVILSEGMLSEEELDDILRKGMTAFDKGDVIVRQSEELWSSWRTKHER